MKPDLRPHAPLNLPALLSVAALFVLGLVGGSLIVAHAGFETSPRRRGTPTFVPAPEAYVLAAAMYAMSGLVMGVLLRHRGASKGSIAPAPCACAAVAAAMVLVMAPA